MWISWKHEQTDFPAPFTFEQKVEVFYEQTLGWQLHISDLVANGGDTFGESKMGKSGYRVSPIRHSGFAVLHICMSYFELIGSIIDSTRSERNRFDKGVRRVLPALIDGSANSKQILDILYKAVRCGLYHDARTRARVALSQPPDSSAIAYDSGSSSVIISPERLPRVLKAHLEQFRRELLDPANVSLRKRFEDRFDTGFSSI